jgi:ABC-type branched-subunit amino acid transport system ATPase component
MLLICVRRGREPDGGRRPVLVLGQRAPALADRAVLMRNGTTAVEVEPSRILQDDALHHEHLGV